jgi:hypothetical protein
MAAGVIRRVMTWRRTCLLSYHLNLYFLQCVSGAPISQVAAGGDSRG